MKTHLRSCRAALFVIAVLLLSLWLPGTAKTAQAAANAPAAPKVTGSANKNVVILKWKPGSGADGVELFKLSSDRKFHWFKSFNSRTTTFKVNGKYNLTYYYKMRSYKVSNGKKIYSKFTSVTVKTAASSKTVITSTSRDKSDSGLVRWRANSYADGYEVFRSTSKKGTFTKIATINKASTHVIRDTKLSSGQTYYYKVRTYRKNKGSVAYGTFGGAKSLPRYDAGSVGAASPEGTVSSSSSRKLLVVGDSRVLYMSAWYPNANVKYIAKSGVGFDWLSSASIQSQILASLDGNTDVFFWIGTNDYDYSRKYVSLYQAKLSEWRAKGARVYLVGLGQFLGGSDGYGGTNYDLVRFNSVLQSAAASLGSDVIYVDLYSYLAKAGVSFLAGDRVHYSAATTRVVYEYLLRIRS